MIIGVRAMSGPPAAQASWVNTHLVYTHGYGVVAATASATATNGSPAFTESDIPPTATGWACSAPRCTSGSRRTITSSPAAAASASSTIPTTRPAAASRTAPITARGGVPVGSLLEPAAVRDQVPAAEHPALGGHRRPVPDHVHPDPAGHGGQGGAVPDPGPGRLPGRGQRPAGLGGGRLHHLDDYPDSPRLGPGQATADTYEPGGGLVGGPAQVNYIRNSVKAVVNAYTGQVTLYQWGQADPLLQPPGRRRSPA